MKKAILAILGVSVFLYALSATALSEPPNKNLLQVAKRLHHSHVKKLKNKNKLVIIDYSLPIYKKRLWVFDLATNKVVFHSHVGHAGLSGIIYATNFSNTPKSDKTSVGSFVTLNTYRGKFGYSLNIKGLDRNINNNAHQRRIIFHKMTNGPWSRGCFTIPQENTKELIDLIKDGVFVYVGS